jgi:hypothetical protein
MFASDDTGAVMANMGLPFGITCQTQTVFQDPSLKDVVNMIMMQKDYRDTALSYKVQLMQGQGVHSFSMM